MRTRRRSLRVAYMVISTTVLDGAEMNQEFGEGNRVGVG